MSEQPPPSSDGSNGAQAPNGSTEMTPEQMQMMYYYYYMMNQQAAAAAGAGATAAGSGQTDALAEQQQQQQMMQMMMQQQQMPQQSMMQSQPEMMPPAAPQYGSAYGTGGERGDHHGFGEAQEGNTLWIGNVAGNATEEDIKQVFEQRGFKAERVRVLSQKNCAFVRFADVEEAKEVHRLGVTEGILMYGQRLRVNWAKGDFNEERQPLSRSLWVGSLTPEVTREELIQLFEQCGHVTSVFIHNSHTYGFVEFSTPEEARHARAKLSRTVLHGQPIKINYGKPDNQRSSITIPIGGGPAPVPQYQTPMYQAPAMQPLEPPAPLAPAVSPSVFFNVDTPVSEAHASNEAVASNIVRFAEKVVKNGVDFERKGIDNADRMESLSFLKEDDPNHQFYVYTVYSMWKTEEEKRQEDHRRALEAYNASVAQRALEQHQQQQQQQQRQEPPREFAPMPIPQHSSSMPPQPGTGPQSHVSQPSGGMDFAAAAAEPPSKLDIFTKEENTAMYAMLRELTVKKDSIANMRKWVLARANRAKLIFESLRFEMEETREFEKKLAYIYLMNDILRHESRSSQHECTDALRSLLPTLMTLCGRGLDSEQIDKITSVLGLWSDNDYYDRDFVSRLRDIIKSGGGGGGGGGDYRAPPPTRRSGFGPPANAQSSGSSTSLGGISEFLGGIRMSVTAEQQQEQHRSHSSHSHSHHDHDHSHGHSHDHDHDHGYDRGHSRDRDYSHDHSSRDGAAPRKRSRFDS